MKFEEFIIEKSPSNFDYNELIVAKNSRYSSLMPWHIKEVSRCFIDETQHLSIRKIVDSTANIGCDSILFRLLYPQSDITAIELDNETFKLLRDNMNNIGNITHSIVKHIDVLNMDCLDYIFNHESDMIYLDPVWGQDYKKNKYMAIYLSDHEIGTVVNQLLKKNPCLIVVKLPYNIDYVKFQSQVINNINQPVYINTHNIYTTKKISYMLSFIRL